MAESKTDRIVKEILGTNQPAQTTGDAFYLPNYSGIKSGARKDSVSTPGSVLFYGSDGNIAEDNANLFWDNTNDRLGIGTTTPGAPLSFADGETLKIQLNANAANYYGISKAAAVNSGDSMFKITAGATAAGEIGFYTTTNARMLINKDGNVGIGTTTPGNPLTVAADGATTMGLLRNDPDGLSNFAAIGSIVFGTRETVDNQERFGASIGGIAEELWVDGSSYGSALTFSVVPTGSTTLTTAVRIGNVVNLQLKETLDNTPTLSLSGGIFVSGGALWYQGFAGTYTRVAVA